MCDFLWGRWLLEQGVDSDRGLPSIPHLAPDSPPAVFHCILDTLAFFCVLKTPHSFPHWGFHTQSVFCLECLPSSIPALFLPMTGPFHHLGLCSFKKSPGTSIATEVLPHLLWQSLVFVNFFSSSKALITCPKSCLFVMCFWVLHHCEGPE